MSDWSSTRWLPKPHSLGYANLESYEVKFLSCKFWYKILRERWSLGQKQNFAGIQKLSPELKMLSTNIAFTEDSWILEETCCHSTSSERPSANADEKNSNNNNNKATIDKTQQHSKIRLCGDRDETINHIIIEYRKLAQKEYKARHDWVGKVIHCKCARSLNLTMSTNGICTTQHLSLKMTHTSSYGTIIYNRIT